MKKLLYLFFALLLPGLIFVFLKYAGRNEFNIPVYFSEGVANPPPNCLRLYSTPYIIADALWPSQEGMGAANVLVFPVVGLTFEKLRKGIEEEFGVGTVWFKEASTLTPDPADLDDWRKCIFLLNQPNQTVLMDKERRIRGFYDLRLRDEVDRLRVELKILLKKY